MKLSRALMAMAAMSMALTGIARAENPRVNVQIFRPSAHVGDLLTTMTSDIVEHTQWSAGLFLHFGKNALVFVDTSDAGEARHEVVQDQLTAELYGTIALFRRLSIGLSVPIFLVNSGEEEGFIPLDPAISSASLGDFRLSPKVTILPRKKDAKGFGLAASLDLTLPTGDGDSFVSDGFQIAPAVIGDYVVGDFHVAANLGYRIRTEGDDTSDLYGFAEAGSELFWRIGGRYSVIPGELSVMAEIYGGSSDWSTANNSHVEGALAGRLRLPDIGLAFTLGGGSGFMKGIGNTKFRVFAGVAYEPERILDEDEDGIIDELDKCPAEPEDKDMFQDDDGCPDPDNDGDKILDGADRCPQDPEDKDEYQDEDGCPDLDNDGDGRLDADDKCPNEAEDVDEFEDEDGCPDADNDGDGILDADDKCPLEAEVLNGKDDGDGCPDETDAKVETGKIVVAKKIAFKRGRATLEEESVPLLEAVAALLKADARIKKVTIEGHTNDVGTEKRNQKLSEDRAKAIMTWLVEHGVAADRLTAQGFGETRPAVLGTTKEAREANERVEFIISE